MRSLCVGQRENIGILLEGCDESCVILRPWPRSSIPMDARTELRRLSTIKLLQLAQEKAGTKAW